MKRLMYVGTYSDPAYFGEDKGFAGRGQGVYVLSFDEESGALDLARLHRGIVNPSYLTLDAQGKRLYCVHELDTYKGMAGGAVSAYDIAPDGRFLLLNTQPTHGGAPCHVALRPQQDMLAVANYSGGSVVLYAVDGQGALGTPQVIQHVGQGPNPARQQGPHVHSIWFTPDGNAAVAADLGTDTLTAYALPSGEKLAAAQARPGDGPRMMAYAERHSLLYVINEMACTIAAYACGARGIPQTWLWDVPTLPHAPRKEDTGADIHLSQDSRFLYASTRGQNLLTVFAVDARDGRLTPVQHIASGGKTPRGFTLSSSGRWLLCGHQDDDTIVVFAVDGETGMLTRQGAYDVPSPVCLVFAP